MNYLLWIQKIIYERVTASQQSSNVFVEPLRVVRLTDKKGFNVDRSFNFNWKVKKGSFSF